MKFIIKFEPTLDGYTITRHEIIVKPRSMTLFIDQIFRTKDEATAKHTYNQFCNNISRTLFKCTEYTAFTNNFAHATFQENSLLNIHSFLKDLGGEQT